MVVLRIFLLAALLFGNVSLSYAALNLDKLSKEDIIEVKALIAKLTPHIQKREAKGTLATLTFDEVYSPLTKDEKAFLKQFETLDAKELKVKIPFRGMATGKEDLIVVKGQKITVNGKSRELPPQYLPRVVFLPYEEMMKAMKKDIGKRLYIESAYRSSAYQLYLFVYYLQNHDYSIRETIKWVALPGYSEHGAPAHQAIDFVNEFGINGENNPPEFEALEEYDWLLKNAGRFGFVLSYPKNSKTGITYEPWHWRYDSGADFSEKKPAKKEKKP